MLNLNLLILPMEFSVAIDDNINLGKWPFPSCLYFYFIKSGLTISLKGKGGKEGRESLYHYFFDSIVQRFNQI